MALRIRTSTGTSAWAPTGRTLFSWIARRSLTCMCRGRSATSSRNSVPPLAAWKRPGRSASAPVKLPFLCPKSSLSIRSSGIAPQFTGTKGPSARGPCSWMRRATNSLPVPDSPLTYTGAWLRASRATRARTACIGAESPTSSRRGLARVPERRSAVETRFRRTCRSTGLETKSKAPALSASTALSTLPWAVMTATGVAGQTRCMCRTRSMPLPSGRRMSVRQRSKAPSASRARARARSSAASASMPMRSSVMARSSRMSGSSSTTRARGQLMRSVSPFARGE